jgi:membrane protease YdiL (CAAX protease family)
MSPSDALPPPPSEDTFAKTGVKRWRWWIHLVVIGAYPILWIPFSWRHIAQRPALTSTARGLLIVCAAQIAFFSIVFALGWFASRASTEELLLRWRTGWWVVPLGIGYSIVIRLALGLMVLVISFILLATHLLTPAELQQSLIANRPDVEKLVDLSATRNNPAYFWLTVTLVSFVVAGLREELWRAATLAAMRALWPETFASRDGQFAAVALIALLFGAAHLRMGMLAAAIAGVIGLLLGVIMVVHKSIWPAVIAHGFFDATTFALLPRTLEKLSALH